MQLIKAFKRLRKKLFTFMMMTNTHVTGFRELYFYKCQCETHLKEFYKLQSFLGLQRSFFFLVSMETFDQEYITPHAHNICTAN